MKLTTFLKELLYDFAASYEKLFRKTYSLALIWTICATVAILFLCKFTNFDESTRYSHNSLTGFLFYRYSDPQTYRLIDLSKIIFIFFIALFSLSVSRFAASEKNTMSFSNAIESLTFNDFFALLITLSIASAIDFGIVFLNGSLHLYSYNTWFYSVLFHLRIYLPLVLFALTLSRLNGYPKINFNLRKLWFLLIGLWLFNEFAFEIYGFINSLVFKLLFTALEAPDKQFIFEGIFSLFLMAFYFIGFHVAMTKPFQIFSSAINTPQVQEQTDPTE